MSSARPRRRAALGGAILLAIAMLLTACAGGSSGTSGGASSDTLTVAMPTFENNSYFPWEYNALGRPPFSPAMEALTMLDPTTGKASPMLADSWSGNADSTVWTFHLHKGIQWQKGYGKFTSADVIYTFDRGKDKGASGTIPQLYLTTLKSVSAPDPNTVVFTMKTPQPTWPSILAGTFIVCKAYLTKVGDNTARSHPVGTGPYEFVSGTPNQEYTYKAVPHHWRHTAAFKNLDIKMISDPNTLAAALRTGEVDAAMISGANLDTLKGKVHFIVQKTGPSSWMVFPWTEPPGTPQYKPDLPWNATNPNDPASVQKAQDVREALNLGFNKQAVVKEVYRGYGHTGKFGWYVSPYDPMWSSMPKVPGYDPAKAKQLLAEAGYPNGFTFNVTVETGLDPTSATILPAFAQDMAKIGVKVNVTSMGYAAFVGHLRAKDLDAAFVYTDPSRPDYTSMVSGVQQQSTFRFLGTHPDLWKESQTALGGSQNEINSFVSKIANELSDTYSTIPIGTKSIVVAADSKVKSWPLTPGQNYLYNFEYAQPN